MYLILEHLLLYLKQAPNKASQLSSSPLPSESPDKPLLFWAQAVSPLSPAHRFPGHGKENSLFSSVLTQGRASGQLGDCDDIN